MEKETKKDVTEEFKEKFGEAIDRVGNLASVFDLLSSTAGYFDGSYEDRISMLCGDMQALFCILDDYHTRTYHIMDELESILYRVVSIERTTTP